MQQIKICILLFLLVIIPLSVSAGEHPGKISGHVFDQKTGLPLPDAVIRIAGSAAGAISQSDGFFFLEKFPLHSFQLSVSVLGYKKKVIRIDAGRYFPPLKIELAPRTLRLDPVIVTATRSDHLLSQVTASSEIVDREQMRRVGAETVGEALASVGGSYLRDYGDIAGLKMLSIRGSGTDQVLVLLNGQRLNTGQGGGFDLTDVPSEGVERIEVIKGGHSALVGSDAIGGTVNIITREEAPLKGFQYGVHSTTGSFGFRKFDFNGVQKVGNFNFFVNYNHLKNKGNFEFLPPGASQKLIRQNNSFKSDNLFFKAKFDLNSQNRLRFFHQNFKGRRGIAGSLGFLSPQASRNERRQIYSLSSENRISPRVNLREQFSFQVYRNQYQDPGAWVPVSDRHESTLGSANAEAVVQALKGVTITGGGEFNREKLESSKFRQAQRDWFSLFVQPELKSALSLNRTRLEWRVVPAVRIDKYSDRPGKVSPKLGMMMQTSGEMVLGIRSNFGESFRMPSFNDLYWPADDWSKGNPGLSPEQSKNFDAGIFLKHYARNSFAVELNYFHNSIRNFINWAPSQELNSFGYQIWSPQNVGHAKISGIETDVKFWFFRDLLNLRLNHTYMEARDAGENQEEILLIYRPKNKFDATAGLNYRQLFFHVNFQFVGSRFTQADNSASLPAYRLMNATTGYLFKLNGVRLETKLQGMNLLNKSVFAIDGYPLPGRAFRVTLGIRY